MTKVLMAGDVDAIKEFVFETSSLPQIRGGSELLLECEAQIKGELRQKYGYEEVYCAGGSFLLEVSAGQAEEIRQELERLYLQKTLAATVTVVYENGDRTPSAMTLSPLDGWAQRIQKAAEHVSPENKFARRMSFLAARMREAKAGKVYAPFYEAFPFGRRCDRCGKRMAAAPDPVEKEKAVCPVCKIRSEKGRKRQEGIRGQCNREFAQFMEGAGEPLVVEQAEDLDHLVKTAKRGYLAFLYADGNDIGKLLSTAQDKTQYRAISEALLEGTKAALFEAIRQVCDPALRENGIWPFDIVNIGGDDVTVLIQAGYAWQLAVEFLERFEKEVNERLKTHLGDTYPRITAACGIAIADVKYPMRYFERLASDVLKQAKRLAKEDPDRPTSALTFLWLPSPVASEKAEPLLSYYRRHPKQDLQMELVARPYSLEQARTLLEGVREIARWPRTLRYRWGEVLEQGVLASVNLIYYDLARRREEQRLRMYQTLQEVGNLAAPPNSPGDVPAPIWYLQRDGQWKTALLDALELAELYAMRPDVEEEAE